MKGVSEVIAIILILMIVIALAALAYTWFSGIFASMTGAAGTAVTTTTQTMVTQFEIEEAKMTGTNLWVYIRNTGQTSFNYSTAYVSVYIDNAVQGTGTTASAVMGCTSTNQMLDKGCVVGYQVAGLTFATICPGGVGSISPSSTKITIGTGLTSITSINC